MRGRFAAGTSLARQLVMHTLVRDLLERKGSRVVTIDQHATVSDAVALMVASRVGSAIVLDGDDICGMFSERDCMVRVVLERLDPSTTPVGEAMTRVVHRVSPHDQVERCMNMMTQARCRHLPVVLGDALIGVVSIGDCVAHLCDDATEENHLLREYICGYYPG